jgi:hypothetical protein
MTTETVAPQANTESATTTEVVNETTQTTEATTENAPVTTETQNAESTGKDSTAENQQPEVDYSFTLPEGYTADEELAGELKALAKENKLSPEAAQKVADLGVKMQMKQAEAWQKTQDAWVEEVKADKEIGGEKLDANIALGKRALETFGGQDLKDLLESTGFGNNPAIIRAFVKIGKAISDDSLVIANGSAGIGPKDMAKTMFPNMN